MNNTFVTHPSVRIKGSENNYNPEQCFDPLCHDKTPHMHCPFCTKMESYSDPVILKAHYRVKHVDKGIDFAGLKVLRCCDQCDIVGVIKGEKKFKGAHWHCYKCKNGFNRRDEAIKHFKTHFRNPQTTFQIQIAQEVNKSINQGYENDEAASSIQTEEFSVQSIHPVLTEAVSSMTSLEEQAFSQASNLSMFQRSLDGHVSMPGVGAMETVGVTGDTQTIMIIQEDGNISTLHETCSTQDISTSEANTSITEVSTSHSDMDQQLTALTQAVETLEKDKLEQQKYIEQLQKLIQEQSQQLAASKLREQTLQEQLSIPMDKSIQDVLEQLELKHKEFLQQQLVQLKRTYYKTTNTSQPKMIVVSANSINSQIHDLHQPITIQTLNVANVTGNRTSGAGDMLAPLQYQNTSNSAMEEDTNEDINAASDLDTIEHSDNTVTDNLSELSPQLVKDENEPQYVIIQHEFMGDSIDEERLEIEDEHVSIENGGHQPPSKKQKI